MEVLDAPLTIDLERLKGDLKRLSQIGLDPETGGLYRMAFTDADMEARAWLQRQMEDAALDVSVDGAGNISAVIEGRDPSAPRVMVGSHIDTVPCAGALDGSLGVITGLECLRVMKETGVVPERTIELIAFSDEEGRFGGMFGSQSLVGEVTPDTLHHAKDMNGVKLADVMNRHGMDPWEALSARRDPATIACFLELHIEQGPVLDRSGEQIGLVEDITGLFKWTVRLRGEPNHAGTTPMEMRRDAFLGLAAFAAEMHRILEENGSDRSRGTIGKVELHPGAPNTVPGEAICSLDVRDTDPEVLRELAAAFRKALSAIARREHLMFDFTVESEIAPVACHPVLLDVLEKSAKQRGFSFRRMPSGAAHDSQIIGCVAPVAMVFVPSRDGKSHSPAEWTPWDDIAAGAQLMLDALMDLSTKPLPSALVDQRVTLR